MVLVFVIGVLALVIILINDRDRQRTNDLNCIATYENQNQQRTQVLSTLSNARTTAQRKSLDKQAEVTKILGTLVKRARAGTSTTTAQSAAILARLDDAITAANQARAAYDKADDVYLAATKANPVPQPVFKCSRRLTSNGSPKTTIATATPSATPATVTRTATTTQPAGTVTRSGTITVTVPQPGPATTATVVVPGPRPGKVTVTVTKTVTPPDCTASLTLPCTLRIPGVP
jgi:hypothetical protein